MRCVLPASAVLLASVVSAMAAEQATCKTDPSVVGACMTLHARVNLTADSGFVLWPVGTDHLILLAGREMPADLRARWDKDTFAFLFGDYEICPLAKDQPGHMGVACIESAQHLVVTHPTEGH